MSKRRREARDQKYTPLAPPKAKPMIGMHGRVRDVYPDPKPTRHGREPEKYEPRDRWQ